MKKELITCSVPKLLVQIAITMALISVVIYLIYFNIFNINEYAIILAATVGYGLYLLYSDVILLINYKKPIIEIDAYGFTDYDSIYGKIYWNNIDKIELIATYPLFILYKETKVLVQLKNKSNALKYVTNKVIAEKALASNNISINTSKINLKAKELQEKLLKYKKAFR